MLATLAKVGIDAGRGELSSSSSLPATQSLPAPLAARKKDLPSPDNREGVRALLDAQDLQATLVARFRERWEGRSRALLCTAAQLIDAPSALAKLNANGLGATMIRSGAVEEGEGGEGGAEGTKLVWEPARCSCEGQILYGNLYSFRPKFPRRRAVADQLASPSECRDVIGASILSMAGLGGGGSARPVPIKNGETAVAAQDFGALCEWVGVRAAGLVAELCGRVRREIAQEWEEDRPLHLAGALLTRLQPPDGADDDDVDDRGQGGGGGGGGGSGQDAGYDYSVAHIDKANVASYDYSSVLYLNSKVSDVDAAAAAAAAAGSFEGGDFCFIDEGGDTLLEPRQGRCVIFSSGAEHLHQAQQVLAGSRFVLASWYTLSPQHGQPIPTATDLMQAQRATGKEEDAEGEEEEEELMDVQAMLDAKIAELQQDLQQQQQQQQQQGR